MRLLILFFKIKGLFLRKLPDRFFYFLAKLLALFWFYIIRIRRGVAIQNIMLSLKVSESEAKKIALNSLINITTSFLEFISQRGVNIDFKNFEQIESHIQSGAIVVTAHTGNWDVLERAAGLKNLRLGLISRRSSFSPIMKFLENIRDSRGEVVFYQNSSIAGMCRFLRGGGFLGIAIDQNMPPRHGRPAVFFNQEVNTTFAPQILSIRTGLPIIPVFIRRVKEKNFEVIAYEAERPKDDSEK
ncbi:MAG: lysophospholipid acyltransferase family protein, partial [Myxococcota bacterium]